MNSCATKINNFYKKNDGDNMLKLAILILNTMNLFFFINTKWCIPNTLVLFGLYMKLSKISKRKKKIMILTWLTFSIFTFLGESFVILLNKSSLTYNNSDIFNVSSWLFSAYANMTMSVIFIDDYYNSILD